MIFLGAHNFKFGLYMSCSRSRKPPVVSFEITKSRWSFFFQMAKSAGFVWDHKFPLVFFCYRYRNLLVLLFEVASFRWSFLLYMAKSVDPFVRDCEKWNQLPVVFKLGWDTSWLQPSSFMADFNDFISACSKDHYKKDHFKVCVTCKTQGWFRRWESSAIHVKASK